MISQSKHLPLLSFALLGLHSISVATAWVVTTGRSSRSSSSLQHSRGQPSQRTAEPSSVDVSYATSRRGFLTTQAALIFSTAATSAPLVSWASGEFEEGDGIFSNGGEEKEDEAGIAVSLSQGGGEEEEVTTDTDTLLAEVEEEEGTAETLVAAQDEESLDESREETDAADEQLVAELEGDEADGRIETIEDKGGEGTEETLLAEQEDEEASTVEDSQVTAGEVVVAEAENEENAKDEELVASAKDIEGAGGEENSEVRTEKGTEDLLAQNDKQGEDEDGAIEGSQLEEGAKNLIAQSTESADEKVEGGTVALDEKITGEMIAEADSNDADEDVIAESLEEKPSVVKDEFLETW